MILAIFIKLPIICFMCIDFSNAKCHGVKDIPHCTWDCSTSSSRLTCRQLHSPAQLLLIMSSILQSIKLKELEFHDSKLRFWPSGIFNGITTECLNFMNCEIFTFSDGGYLDVLDAQVKDLYAFNSNLIDQGKWKFDVRSLKRLEKLEIYRGKIPKLTNSISSMLPELLKNLQFHFCEIEEIEDGFFMPLKNLEYLFLNGNKIKNLPIELETLSQLEKLDLGINEILQLPENMMKIFPKLSFLSLQANEIEHLPENVWKDILEKVDIIILRGNPLICDADMKWILEVKLKSELSWTECAEPERLREKSLLDLKSEDFEQEAEIARDDEIDS